jgi:hypothetical protein
MIGLASVDLIKRFKRLTGEEELCISCTNGMERSVGWACLATLKIRRRLHMMSLWFL